MKDIEEIGFNLTRHEEERWKTLRKHTLEIFIEQNKREHDEQNEANSGN